MSSETDERWSVARDEFKEEFSKNQILFVEACEAFQGLVRMLLANNFPTPPKVTGRVKDRDECIKKFELKYLPSQEKADTEQYSIMPFITDVIGLRVICIYESDIGTAGETLRKNLKILAETDKTSALKTHDNQFGYKGLHLDIELDADRAKLPEYERFAGLKFEVQVRSIVQDAWSEVDHRLKYKKRIPSNLKRRINRLAALFELADQEFEAIRDNTSSLEKEVQKKPVKGTEDQPLNAFSFLRIAQKYFPGEEFVPYKVDGFVDEVLNQTDSMTESDLDKFLNNHLEKVQSFKKYLAQPPLDHSMNAFTQIRHCLYLEDPDKYGLLMRAGPMINFDRWSKYGTVHPSEIPAK